MANSEIKPAEAEGILSKGDTYDASLFREDHRYFKEHHNRIFGTLSARLRLGLGLANRLLSNIVYSPVSGWKAL